MELEKFLTELSSGAPVPGGGGASALGGALGAALGQMVANLTAGKKKYAQWEADIQDYLKRLEDLKVRFLRLAEEDEEVFAPLAEAYRLPAGTEEERRHKETVMEERLLNASLVPLKLMETAVETLQILEGLEEKGSVMAVSDVGVAVQFARTAVTGGAVNVFINTKSMKDRKKAGQLNCRAEQMVLEGTKTADSIYDRVTARLCREQAG